MAQSSELPPDTVSVFARDAASGRPVAEEISGALAAKRLASQETHRSVVPERRDKLGAVALRDDPSEVGWVVVVGAADPAKSDLVEALTPLAARRGGLGSWGPLEFPEGAEVDTWVEEKVNNRDPAPAYVLLAGSPQYLPFRLQSVLSSIASVGRLDFSTISGDVETQHPDAVKAYVTKVCAVEEGQVGPCDRSAVFWAPAHAGEDPTVYSRRVLAAPLATRARDKRRFAVTELYKENATASSLVAAGTEGRPALLFAASHGTAVHLENGLAAQAVGNGLPVGQDGTDLTLGELPDPSVPFVEGGVVFQFACFGYGTPASSGYTHWWPDIEAYHASREVVSTFPKALLQMPRGPLGYVGHADYAVLHSFTDADAPAADPADGSGPRMAGFRSAVDAVLSGWRCGAVLQGMGRQLGLLNSKLADAWDAAKAADRVPEADTALVDAFIRRNDARYYFLLGDPAAAPRLAEPV